MDLFSDALEFERLCSKYRESRDDKVMRQIRELIYFNAERVANNFSLTLKKSVTKIEAGKGVVMVAENMTKLIANPWLRKSRMTCLNVRGQKDLHGVNILLDYSGSMWFNERKNCVGEELPRIYAQNFLALVLGVYLQRMSRGKMKIVYTGYCQTPITLIKGDNVLEADWDGLIVHSHWGSGCKGRKEYMPEVLKGCNSDWFCNEYVREAFDSSMRFFKGEKLKDYINVFITDGGMHRLGESEMDRMRFLKNLLTGLGVDSLVFFWLIKEQKLTFKEMLKEAGIKYGLANSREDFDNVFDYLTSLINELLVAR